jgi:hypothetical protein
LNYCLLT